MTYIYIEKSHAGPRRLGSRVSIGGHTCAMRAVYRMGIDDRGRAPKVRESGSQRLVCTGRRLWKARGLIVKRGSNPPKPASTVNRLTKSHTGQHRKSGRPGKRLGSVVETPGALGINMSSSAKAGGGMGVVRANPSPSLLGSAEQSEGSLSGMVSPDGEDRSWNTKRRRQ